MSHHFSDPYVEAVYATITSTARSCSRAELLAENPEEEPGDLSAALRELSAAGLAAAAGGRYFKLSGATKAAADPVADGQAHALATAVGDSALSTPDPLAPKAAKPARPADPPDVFTQALAQVAAAAPVQPTEKDAPMTNPIQYPRHQVLVALRDHGPSAVARVRELMAGKLDAKAVANSLYTCVNKGEAEITSGGKNKIYRITKAGLSIIGHAKTSEPQSAAPAKPSKRAAKRVKKVARAKTSAKVRKAAKAATTDTRSIAEINKAARKAASRVVPFNPPREPEVLPRPIFAPEGFRCGLFSDGGLAIVAGDTEMQLDAQQTRALIGFLEHTTVLRAGQ